MFAAKETLNRHRKLHTGEKPYACTICDRRFIQATQMKSHMFKHTGQKGFSCFLCDKQFNRKSLLGSHVKKVHKNMLNLIPETEVNPEPKEIKKMKCKICCLESDSFEDLVKHMNDSHRFVLYRCVKNRKATN